MFHKILNLVAGLSLAVSAIASAQTITVAGGGASTKPVNNHVATRCISGKSALVPLSATSGLYFGQSASAASTGVTFNVRVATAGAFDAIRVGIPNVASTPVTGVKVGLAYATGSQGWQSSMPGVAGNIGQPTGGNPNNVNVAPNPQWFKTDGGTAFGWGKFYFADRSKTEIDLAPAVDATRGVQSYTFTDWAPGQSVARTDGGTLPLVDIRIVYPRAGATPASGAASSSPGVTLTAGQFANWGIDGAIDGGGRTFNGGMLWKVWSEPTDTALESGTNFQGSNNPFTFPNSPPIIVQTRMNADVQTILYQNDSIGEFTNAGEYANSYAFRGARAAAAATGKTISWCALTWPSGSSLDYGRLANSVIDYIQPAILWAKPFGPNESGPPLTQLKIDMAIGDWGMYLAQGQKYGSTVIIEPHLAVSNANHNWGAQDAFRTSFNTFEQTNAAARKYIFADLDTPWIAGGTVVSGQQQPATANSYDGTHSSDTGHAALTPNATVAATAALNAR